MLLALVVYYREPERDEDVEDDTTVGAVTEPTMRTKLRPHYTTSKDLPVTPGTIPTPSTTTTIKPMICTVSDTLSIEDPITEGICDYAIFSDLTVVDGDLKPVQGRYAWEVFKKAISHSDRTLGGVSFSSHKAMEREGTMRKLRSVKDKLLELVVDYKMLALGMLGFRHDFSQREDVFGKTFEYLKAALELRDGSMTFLGLWFITAKNAEAFAKLLGNTQSIDFIIIQTHITMTAQNGSCYAYMISEGKEFGDVPNFATAEVALRRLREVGVDGLRVLFSSSMAVMAYVSAKGSPSVGPRRRKCDRSFLADIDSVCRETLGYLQSEYWPDDMSESITFREFGSGYMFVFESINSLNGKATRYGNMTDGWAFFEIQRDVYWPCSTGRAYGRVKHGISVMRGKRSAIKSAA
ncbi:uncharacterized protein [Dermacentor albipictus]|uniref:uncharacterized protein n=1 Tax=Dermacentor albipictus TaxID=60249 RepID=UPI0031FD7F6E